MAAMDEAQPYSPSDGPGGAYTALPARHAADCQCGWCDDDGIPYSTYTR